MEGFTAFFFTLLAVLVLIPVHIGQTSSPTRLICMANVNVTDYGDALFSALSRPILGLYTDNASAPLNARAGLRQVYKFGLYSHCAYVNQSVGSCTSTAAAYQFRPYTAITNDMLSNYSTYTDAIIRDTAFANSSSLGRSSHTAYYLLLFGSILSAVSLVTGMIHSTWTLFLSASTAIVAGMSVLSGSAIWSVLIKRAKDVNSWTVQPGQFPLGIEVTTGIGLHCAWVAFGLLAISIIFHTSYIIDRSSSRLCTPRWVLVRNGSVTIFGKRVGGSLPGLGSGLPGTGWSAPVRRPSGQQTSAAYQLHPPQRIIEPTSLA